MDDYIKKTICKGRELENVKIWIGNVKYVFDKCSLHYAKEMKVANVVLTIKSKDNSYKETVKKSWVIFG
jgi:hypothetical protein